jgi:hypothetical protein
MGMFSYLEGFINTRCRCSRLGDLSSSAYENIHLSQNKVFTWRGSLRQSRTCSKVSGFAE